MTPPLRVPDSQPADSRTSAGPRGRDARGDKSDTGQAFDGILSGLNDASASASSQGTPAKAGAPSTQNGTAMTPTGASPLPSASFALRQAVTPGAPLPAATSFAQQVASSVSSSSPSADAHQATDEDKTSDTATPPAAIADPTLLAMALVASGAATQTVAPQTGQIGARSSTTAGAAAAGMRRQPPDAGSSIDAAPSPAVDAAPTANENGLIASATLVTHLPGAPQDAPSTPASGPSPIADATGKSLSGAPAESAVPTTPAPAADPETTDVAAARPAPAEPPPLLVMPQTLTPTQAVAHAISAALPAAPANAATADTPPAPVAAAPRTMTLQLTPPSLGTVSVTMHLASGALDLSLTASDSTTGDALRRDKDTLAAAVQDQGYDLRSLVVHGADASGGASANANTAHQESGAQSWSGSGEPSSNAQREGTGQGGGNQATGGQSGPDRESRDPSTPSRTAKDDASRSTASSGALYL